jgi:signal transduction histidine kinase
VGGLIVAMQVDSLMDVLRERSQAAIVAIYDSDGKALHSSLNPVDGIADLNINQVSLKKVQENGGSGIAVFTVPVNARDYQFAYSALQVRDTTIGILSVALARDYVLNAWADTRWPMTLLTVSLMVAIVGLGVYIARLITAPLQELVITAHAVTAGNLDRRSAVRSSDEVGMLSTSFNTMTEHLLALYDTVRAESSERAAIVESIADGIVVCDTKGRIRSVNQAMRLFLHLELNDPLPHRFADINLERLADNAGFSERRVNNLFTLNERIVRVSASPVVASDGVRLGSVCVLQDMTEDVAVDRAKTNFIATISHELRTPLTVLRGNADLLLRGLVGPLEADQKMLIETMRAHSTNMTSLVNNVIVIAGLDSGSLVSDPEILELRRIVEEAVWPVRSQITAKGLELRVDVASDLPLVYVDMFQTRTVVAQLLDNARRYTSKGSVTVSARDLRIAVQVDVTDTGRGIPASLRDNLFRRFVRGDGANEGINSSERGIGLGLAIVKQLVERQGGKVWIADSSESGTTVSFTLPYANATQQPDQPSGSLAA